MSAEEKGNEGPKYPKINVQLVGVDGNAFSILGRAGKAMRKAKLPQEEQAAFMTEAQSGDYTNLLSTVMKWFATDGGDEDSDRQSEEEADAEWDEHWAETDAAPDKVKPAECIECGEPLNAILELNGVNVCDECDEEGEDICRK